MPSIRSSAKPNMKGWEPATTASQNTPLNRNPKPSEDFNTRSPYMHASMPLMASTNDALRQFYSQANVPQQRILPAKKGGASQ